MHVPFRSKTKLQISWKEPNTQTCNCEITGYKICYSTHESAENCEVAKELSGTETQATITSLISSTKYFVTVSAKTRAGYGPKSKKISKITNGGRNFAFACS